MFENNYNLTSDGGVCRAVHRPDHSLNVGGSRMAHKALVAEIAISQAARDVRAKWVNPSGTKTYYAWRSMRARCHNPTNAAWENYGGRGISVCARWRQDYDAFFADMGECPEGGTLDRIDVNGDYTPENCRWVGWDVQSVNKRTNVNITHNGVTMTVCQWADHLGIERDTLCRRFNHLGMDAARALTPGSLQRKAKCGTRQGYTNGCRCEACRASNATRAREMRAKRKGIDGAGYFACGGEIATEGSE